MRTELVLCGAVKVLVLVLVQVKVKVKDKRYCNFSLLKGKLSP